MKFPRNLKINKMSTFLYLYPAYKTAEFLELENIDNISNSNRDHWLVFWLLSFLLNLITFLPSWIIGTVVVLLYFPETTDFCKKTIVKEVTPKAKILIEKMSNIFKKKINSSTQNTPIVTTSYFQSFWNSVSGGGANTLQN